jgi:hypothetical protein
VNDAQFFEEVVALLIQCDPERLSVIHEITLGFLMDQLYPHAGAELN